MLSRYLKQASVFTLVFALTTIVTRAINFLYLPIIVSKLDLTQLGILELINTFFNVVTTILCSLSATGMIRFYYAYQDNKEKQDISIGVSCITGLVTSCLAAPCLVYGVLLYFPVLHNVSMLVWLASINLIFFCLFSVVTTYLRITEQLTWYLIASVSQNIIAIGITMYLLQHNYGVASCLWGVCISCAPFVVIFFGILARHLHFTFTQLHVHLTYVLPLVIYGILFSYFISIDKLLLAQQNGYALLGLYGVLWRFGQLFIICSQALMDAWPMIIYKVHQENQSSQIISRLITYYASSLCYLGLTASYVTTYSIAFLFPQHVHDIIPYAPLFFVSLVFLDLARLCQTAFNIVQKTLYIPLIATSVIGMQTILLTTFHVQTIFQCLLINSFIFAAYASMSMFIGNHVYHAQIFNYRQLFNLMVLMGLISSFLWLGGQHHLIAHTMLIVCIPLLAWISNLIAPEEKGALCSWLARQFFSYVSRTILFEHKAHPLFVQEHSYTSHIHNQRVLILGPVPPPRGGVSIHIIRSAQLLAAQHNKVMHLDTIARPWPFPLYCLTLFFRIITSRASIFFYHTTYSYRAETELFIIRICAKLMQASCIIIDHDPRYLYQKTPAQKLLLNTLFLACNKHIVIGSSTYKSYEDNSILHDARLSIESSFIPPDIASHDSIWNSYPPSLKIFLSTHYPIIAVNAFSISTINGKDLYGLDLCMELLKTLTPHFPEIGMVIAYVQILDQVYMHKLESLIAQYDLEKHLYMFKNEEEFWPIISQSTLFLRPTRSDSLGISIAESIHLNIPAIASDVCARPPGTILFKTGDLTDLCTKVQTVLDQHISIQGHRETISL